VRPVARRVVRDWRPEVISVEHDYAAPWAAELSEELPAVLTLENVSWRYYESRARAVRQPAASTRSRPAAFAASTPAPSLATGPS
jgi:hypothetical protein